MDFFSLMIENINVMQEKKSCTKCKRIFFFLNVQIRPKFPTDFISFDMKFYTVLCQKDMQSKENVMKCYKVHLQDRCHFCELDTEHCLLLLPSLVSSAQTGQ